MTFGPFASTRERVTVRAMTHSATDMIRPFSPQTADLIESAHRITRRAEAALRSDQLGQEAGGYLRAALAELRSAVGTGDVALANLRLDALVVVLDTFTVTALPAKRCRHHAEHDR